MKDFVVIYHADCVDGFTAAWIAHRYFGETADYLPYKYGEDPPEFHGNEKVYILDFSFPRKVLLKMKEEVTALHICDHHKSAEEELRSLADSNFGSPVHSLHFDMDKCGARLTWEYLYSEEDPPSLIDYVEDRDLWKWELNYSKEISAALQSYDFTWKNWDQLASWLNDTMQKMGVINQGEAILRYQEQSIKKHMNLAVVREAWWTRGLEVPMVNCTDKNIVSELGNRLAKDYSFSACYAEDKDSFPADVRIWSLRAIEGEKKADVSAIAKATGSGGGHKLAAGFTEKI